jgi:hypothetical protein
MSSLVFIASKYASDAEKSALFKEELKRLKSVDKGV